MPNCNKLFFVFFSVQHKNHLLAESCSVLWYNKKYLFIKYILLSLPLTCFYISLLRKLKVFAEMLRDWVIRMFLLWCIGWMFIAVVWHRHCQTKNNTLRQSGFHYSNFCFLFFYFKIYQTGVSAHIISIV